MRDVSGNWPPLPGVFPDYAAPIVRNATDGRERWPRAETSPVVRKAKSADNRRKFRGVPQFEISARRFL
jgi:hypothetical protein